LLVTALVAAFALAACGGGGGGSKTPSATKTVVKTATAQPGATTVASTPSPTASEATQPAAQPTATRAAAQPPVAQPTSTPPPGAQTTIGVSLREFSLGLSAGSAPSGTVTFNVSNDGTIPHDFWVIRSDLAADGLPVNPATYLVDESQVNVVAKQPPLATEDSAQLPANLAAGRYVLICNVATHYETGMRVAFTVQ
jgi:uncharacterized cupredoxin-like copper-binding protein